MKHTRMLFLVLVVLLMPVAASAQSNSALEVQDLERAWLNAYEQHDQKAMGAILGNRQRVVGT